MLDHLSVGEALAYALQRASCPRGAVNLDYFSPTEQADFHKKCEELGVPTSEQVVADLRHRKQSEAA